MEKITARTQSVFLGAAMALAALAFVGLMSKIEASVDLPVVLLPEAVITTSQSAALATLCDDAAQAEARKMGIEAIAALPAPGTQCDASTAIAASPAQSQRFETATAPLDNGHL